MSESYVKGHAESFVRPQKEVIATPHAPQAIGPYSQAICLGDFVFTAGQVALNPQGQLVGEDISAQTRQVLTNLKAILEAAGASLSTVVKTTVFLTDMAHFRAMNAVYAEFFSPEAGPPARSTVQVTALPLGALVEIEAIAALH